MFAKLHSMNVHLDLDLNRYTGAPVLPEPVDFDACSKTHRDFSAQAFCASDDVLLFPRFQWATATARAYRWRSIRHIAKTAARSSRKMEATVETSSKVLSQRIAAYHHLKTLRFFHVSCIPDALACLFFLSDLGCSPNFVIGVRERPFRAHAWLEINGMVANDVIGNVFNYIPILQTADEGNLREISR